MDRLNAPSRRGSPRPDDRDRHDRREVGESRDRPERRHPSTPRSRHSAWRPLGTALLALALAGCTDAPADARPSADTPPADTPPARIASTTLGTDELLALLVDPRRVVLVTTFVDDPQTSTVLGHYPPEIPRLEHLSLERVLAVDPDLVLVAPFSSRDVLDLLETSGLPVFVNESFTSFEGIAEGLVRLGERVGAPERARAEADAMRARLAVLEEQIAHIEHRPRVVYWSAGWTAGTDTTIGETIERAGGVNVGGELGIEGMARVAEERVLEAAPDVVLLNGFVVSLASGDALPPGLAAQCERGAARLVLLDGPHLTTLSPRVVDAAYALARRLHPDLTFAEPR